MSKLPFILTASLFLVAFVSAFSYDNPNLPRLTAPTPTVTSANNNTLNVNNSIYWNGHSFVFGAVSSIENDPIWNANYSTHFNTAGTGLQSSGKTVSANLSYLDDRYANANLVYYFWNSSSGITNYKVMNTSVPQIVTIISNSITVPDTGIVLNFTNEKTNLTSLKAGVGMIHIHASRGATATGNLYYELYKRDVAGTETLLSTSENSETLTTSLVEYNLHIDIPNTNLNVSDILVIKIRYHRLSGTATTSVSTQIEGDTLSRFELPVVPQSIVLNEIDPIFNAQKSNIAFTNASTSWGTNNVTANQITSTVATGNSPLVVTSTTKVVNLNADMCDGYHTGTIDGTIPILNNSNTWNGTNTIGGANKLQFRDTNSYIGVTGFTSGVMTISASNSITLSAPTINFVQLSLTGAFCTNQIAITPTGSSNSERAYITLCQLSTTNGSRQAIWTDAMGIQSSEAVRVTVDAIDTGNYTAGSYSLEGAYVSPSTTAVQVGAVDKTSREQDTTWDAELNTTSGSVRVMVTGATGRTVNWLAKIETVRQDIPVA